MIETIIRISEDGKVMVEKSVEGVKSFKQIAPDSLLECISRSLIRGAVTSGLQPRGCLSFTSHDNGDRDVYILHPEDRADISYYGTEYKDFPLPRLAFGFHISREGRVSSCRLGVVDKDDVLKPETKMFHYPFSNVSGFHLCTGNNTFPKVASLHTLGSLPITTARSSRLMSKAATRPSRPGRSCAKSIWRGSPAHTGYIISSATTR